MVVTLVHLCFVFFKTLKRKKRIVMIWRTAGMQYAPTVLSQRKTGREMFDLEGAALLLSEQTVFLGYYWAVQL